MWSTTPCGSYLPKTWFKRGINKVANVSNFSCRDTRSCTVLQAKEHLICRRTLYLKDRHALADAARLCAELIFVGIVHVQVLALMSTDTEKYDWHSCDFKLPRKLFIYNCRDSTTVSMGSDASISFPLLFVTYCFTSDFSSLLIFFSEIPSPPFFPPTFLLFF